MATANTASKTVDVLVHGGDAAGVCAAISATLPSAWLWVRQQASRPR